MCIECVDLCIYRVEHLHNFLTVTRVDYIYIYCSSIVVYISVQCSDSRVLSRNASLSSAFLSGSNAVFTLVVNLPSLVKARAVNGGREGGGAKICYGNRAVRGVITRTVTSLFRLAKLCLNGVRVNNTPYK